MSFLCFNAISQIEPKPHYANIELEGWSELGKASRSKGSESAERVRRDRARQIRTFLSRAGARDFTSPASFWDGALAAFGNDYCDLLEAEIARRATGDYERSGVYEVLYRDLETAVFTARIVSPMLSSWLETWSAAALPEGDVLDLGCGSGVATCFYAASRPTSQIVGVDQSRSGIERGRELAAKLGLTNVEFMAGDIAGLDLGRRFQVVCSTAVLTDLEPATDHRPVFSHLAQIRRELSTGRSALADTAARHLDQGGTYISGERLPTESELAHWVGALNAAGLRFDTDASLPISFHGALTGPESIPVLIANRESDLLGATQLLRWHMQHLDTSDTVGPELELAQLDQLQLIEGHHFDVMDAGGAGATRLYVFGTNDSGYAYMTTSRGYRAILAEVDADEIDALAAEVQARAVTMRGDSTIVGYRPLAASDFEADLDRTGGWTS
jgi:SAM-dependent methyltransferase